jgi:hypothetical protein
MLGERTGVVAEALRCCLVGNSNDTCHYLRVGVETRPPRSSSIWAANSAVRSAEELVSGIDCSYVKRYGRGLQAPFRMGPA